MSNVLSRLQKYSSVTHKTRKEAHRIQIGFDFGTSYSKCVYRDLSTSQAHVFTFDIGNKKEFLLSSTIIYKNGFFYFNEENQQYLEHGLWHLKIALANLMHNQFRSPTLLRIDQEVGLRSGTSEQSDFIRAACLFYISRALRVIQAHIRSQDKYQDFGTHEQDDMYVTMAIPVSDMKDEKIKEAFLDILKKAWCIACQPGSISSQASIQEMKSALLQTSIEKARSCHVYPEVSANIQPFRTSSQSPGSSSRIYLVTDVGSGTVDQCCFTLSAPNNADSINYFSAQVFELGAGAIERRCVALGKGNREMWCQQKKKNADDWLLSQIKRGIAKELNHAVSTRTLPQLTGQLHKSKAIYGIAPSGYDKYFLKNKDYDITPENSVRRLLHLIFTGGGDMKNPYHTSVIEALRSQFGDPRKDDGTSAKALWEDRVIQINTPSDLILPKGCKHWMKRLYVAYGLSYKYEELPNHWYPSSPLIYTYTNSERQKCRYCGGENQQCIHCNGSGWE